MCSCVLHFTRHSLLTQLVQKFGVITVSGDFVDTLSSYKTTLNTHLLSISLKYVISRVLFSMRQECLSDIHGTLEIIIISKAKIRQVQTTTWPSCTTTSALE